MTRARKLSNPVPNTFSASRVDRRTDLPSGCIDRLRVRDAFSVVMCRCVASARRAEHQQGQTTTNSHLSSFHRRIRRPAIIIEYAVAMACMLRDVRRRSKNQSEFGSWLSAVETAVRSAPRVVVSPGTPSEPTHSCERERRSSERRPGGLNWPWPPQTMSSIT